MLRLVFDHWCLAFCLEQPKLAGIGDVEYGKIREVYLPPAFLRLYDGPSINLEDMWQILGSCARFTKPKLGLQLRLKLRQTRYFLGCYTWCIFHLNLAENGPFLD